MEIKIEKVERFMVDGKSFVNEKKAKEYIKNKPLNDAIKEHNKFETQLKDFGLDKFFDYYDGDYEVNCIDNNIDDWEILISLLTKYVESYKGIEKARENLVNGN